MTKTGEKPVSFRAAANIDPYLTNNGSSVRDATRNDDSSREILSCEIPVKYL